jgi:hypothetical protein
VVVTMNKGGRSCWWRGKRGSTTLKYVTAKSSPDNRSKPGKFGKSFETDRATADLYHSECFRCCTRLQSTCVFMEKNKSSWVLIS